jgi:hypothetical protein
MRRLIGAAVQHLEPMRDQRWHDEDLSAHPDDLFLADREQRPTAVDE